MNLPTNNPTYLLELRIVATALDTGIMPDLDRGDFQDEDLGLIWGVMQRYAQEHGKFDYVILGEHLLQTVGLDKREYLRELADERIQDINLLESYADALRSHSDQGILSETLSELTMKSLGKVKPDILREEAIEKLRAISVRKRSEVMHLKEILAASIDNLEKLYQAGDLPGIKTGFPRLDSKLGGWQSGDLALLAARPAVGKTAMMCNFALAANCRVGIVSTEQPAVQIVNRLLSITAEIPTWKFRAPRAFREDEWARLPQAAEKIANLPITIMDHTRPTVGDIERTFERSDIEVLFVDYLQRLDAPGEDYARISAIARNLKDLARNFDIPVVALSQINRAGSKNAGMEHLKGSGDQEQEADEVLILSRGESENTAVMTVEKNRHGPTGSIDLIFRAPCLVFQEAAHMGGEK